MAERAEVDVLIIGAGPTGLTTANLLADAGLSVALLEANPGSGDEPRAISATDETLRVMQHLGIMDRLAPEMLMDTGARYFGLGGKVIADVRPGNRRLGQPGKSQFDQPVLEGLLYEAATQREQISLHFNTSATSITQDEHGVRVAATRLGERSLGYTGALAGDSGLQSAPPENSPVTELEFNVSWVISLRRGPFLHHA